MAAYTAASAVAAALLLVASVRRVPAGALTALENIPDPELNDRFLHATGGGVAGEDFVQRLEDVWFIEKHSGREDLAVETCLVVGDRHLVDRVDIERGNHRFFTYVAEQRNLFSIGRRQRSVDAAHEDVRPNTESEQSLH